MDSIALKYVHNKQEQDLLLQLDNLDYLKIEWIKSILLYETN